LRTLQPYGVRWECGRWAPCRLGTGGLAGHCGWATGTYACGDGFGHRRTSSLEHWVARMSRNRERPSHSQDDVEMGGQVYRRTPLDLRPARGHLLVSADVVEYTERALRGSYGPDGRHEGIVFWVGRRIDDDHLVASAVVPRSTHGRGFIEVSANEVGEVLHQARSRRLVMLAQVHSHPGNDTRHSDADDRLVFMPQEGTFSLVVANYGMSRILAEEGVGVHQFQDGHWVQVEDPETSLIIVPGILHT
jgi:hypothetical protein